MIILLTGVCGFIGSNLLEYFLEKTSYQIIGIDNCINSNLDNITKYLLKEKFKYYDCDLSNFKYLQDFIKDKNVDIICHQAALASVPKSLENPELYIRNNVQAFANLLEVARLYNIKRVVYASSSSVYGDNDDDIKVEENIGKCISPYALSKLVNEQYAEFYHRIFGIETIGFRYFNVFGKNQITKGVYAPFLTKMIAAINNNEVFAVNGDGTITRDFTYIKNVVFANVLAIKTTNTNTFGNVYNVGGGESVSLNDCINIVAKELDKRPMIVYKGERSGDVKNSRACINKIRKDLGYKVKFTFEKGIKDYLTYINDVENYNDLDDYDS